MVRHIVVWNYVSAYSEKQKEKNAKKMKAALESLIHYIDGIIELRVIINPLSSSNANVILNSLFENNETLAAYQIHPEYKRVSRNIAKIMNNKKCIDYFE